MTFNPLSPCAHAHTHSRHVVCPILWKLNYHQGEKSKSLKEEADENEGMIRGMLSYPSMKAASRPPWERLMMINFLN